MRKMKKILFSLLCMILPAVTFASCGSGSSNSASEGVAQAEAAAGPAVVGPNDPQIKIVDNLLVSENLPIIVDFNATWCGPCRAFAPIFDSVAEKYKGQVIFVSVDTDQYPELAKAYRVSAIPSVAFIMPGGQLYGMQQGLMTEEQFVDYVNQLVATSAGESGVI